MKGWKRSFYAIPVKSNEADLCVLYPHFPSEFDIQTELYGELSFLCYSLDNKTEIKSEVTAFYDKIKSRFDLMIFKDRIPICAIEVKRYQDKSENQEHQQYKQKIRYEMFARASGIPVLYCTGMKDVRGIVEKVKDIII
jgi:hypothetical protein